LAERGGGDDACDAVRALVASTTLLQQHHVYADLSSGAMAFFPTDLCDVRHLRAVVLLGGVREAAASSSTSTSSGCRLSCTSPASYCAPAGAHALLRALTSTTLVLCVTQNAVPAFLPTPHGCDLRAALRRNGFTGGLLEPLLAAYYEDNPFGTPKRADALYSARVLARLITQGTAPPTTAAFWHGDAAYGIALVSEHALAVDALHEYYYRNDATALLQSERATLITSEQGDMVTVAVRDVAPEALQRLTCQ
jgi:hypothetical protein